MVVSVEEYSQAMRPMSAEAIDLHVPNQISGEYRISLLAQPHVVAELGRDI